MAVGDRNRALRNALVSCQPAVEGQAGELFEMRLPKPERHWLVQGSDVGSGGLIALSQTGG